MFILEWMTARVQCNAFQTFYFTNMCSELFTRKDITLVLLWMSVERLCVLCNFVMTFSRRTACTPAFCEGGVVFYWLWTLNNWMRVTCSHSVLFSSMSSLVCVVCESALVMWWYTWAHLIVEYFLSQCLLQLCYFFYFIRRFWGLAPFFSALFTVEGS